MLLSVVLVNYKVPQLTIEAVRSVLASCRRLDGEVEVIVLDNASGDDSMTRLRTAFGAEPRVKLLESATNGGFARGNNQAIAEAHGDYLLLLNPDTLVGESTLAYCLTFLQTHPDAGAVGPRLINQSGVMHPECKRGVPTLWHSFCRFTRLYRVAPHSAWLNGYYQGHLSPDEVQQVPVRTRRALLYVWRGYRSLLHNRAGGLPQLLPPDASATLQGRVGAGGRQGALRRELLRSDAPLLSQASGGELVEPTCDHAARTCRYQPTASLSAVASQGERFDRHATRTAYHLSDACRARSRHRGLSPGVSTRSVASGSFVRLPTRDYGARRGAEIPIYSKPIRLFR